MKRVLLNFSVLISCLTVCWVAHAAWMDSWQISATGLGPIKVGMTTKEAERASGAKLAKEPLSRHVQKSCQYASFAKEPINVLVMLNNDRIVRIDVGNGRFQTSSGIQMGSSFQQVISAYGKRVKIEPDKYGSMKGWKNIIVSSPDKNFELIFDTNGLDVTNIRLGRLPEVEFVERCS